MKLSGIITVPFHIGDFLSGTMHMDTLEKGAYIMLLLAHYQVGETGLPNDDKKLARIAGVSGKIWSRIKETVTEKFEERNGFLVQKVVLECLQRVHDNSSKQRIKALKRHGAGDAAAQPQQCQPKPKPKPSILSKDNITPLTPRGESKRSRSRSIERPGDVTENTWDDFLAHRKMKRATVTETVIKKFRDEAGKAGISLQEAIEVCISNGWQGFNASWMKGRENEYAGKGTQGAGNSNNQGTGFGGRKSQSQLATEETERIIEERRKRHAENQRLLGQSRPVEQIT